MIVIIYLKYHNDNFDDNHTTLATMETSKEILLQEMFQWRGIFEEVIMIFRKRL